MRQEEHQKRKEKIENYWHKSTIYDMWEGKRIAASIQAASEASWTYGKNKGSLQVTMTFNQNGSKHLISMSYKFDHFTFALVVIGQIAE